MMEMLHHTILFPSRNELKALAFQKDFLDTNSESCDRLCVQIEENGLYQTVFIYSFMLFGFVLCNPK
jgi:hypothetical protein